MKLDYRNEQILNFIVRHYVDTAVPVSSGVISQKSKIEVSPATVRNIMLELDKEGFLTQPHTSAGRIPTEKGYRYFIKHCAQTRAPSENIQKEINKATANIHSDLETAFDELSHVIARRLKLFSGIGVLTDNPRVFSYGIAEVMQEPELQEHSTAMQFAKIIDHLDDEMDKFISEEMMMRVDVGTFGMVSRVFHNEDIGKCVLFSIGPQRMNYEAASSLLKYTVDDIINHINET